MSKFFRHNKTRNTIIFLFMIVFSITLLSESQLKKTRIFESFLSIDHDSEDQNEPTEEKNEKETSEYNEKFIPNDFTFSNINPLNIKGSIRTEASSFDNRSKDILVPPPKI